MTTITLTIDAKTADLVRDTLQVGAAHLCDRGAMSDSEWQTVQEVVYEIDVQSVLRTLRLFAPQTWACESDNHRFCEYDHDADPAHDSCLWCGQPWERK